LFQRQAILIFFLFIFQLNDTQSGQTKSSLVCAQERQPAGT